MTRNKFGKIIKVLRNEDGGDCAGKETDFLKDQGIFHQLTALYSPEQIGVSFRCLLSEATLPQRFWAEAVITVKYIQNRLPTKPKGYITLGEEQSVCKLKKSLYGLKQAAKASTPKIAEVPQLNSFQQIIADNCLFIEEKGKIIFVILYVDVPLIASGDEKKINEIGKSLQEKFEI
ncbi:retrovirus-related Pol polyprotein from transposon TNT 1-94 [Nephila pilipes]|uniref:Retrovirus-related Pol polyprotein from transposon TNT 1-94 n=1 Tax=Nephila pilipes TaxID=299642 RepID=A0A8X6PS78_NEPPI|nr:retrovirus-related Pol polyprotein from transposon TNT 1-94 [Nephila pilipes]